MLLKIKLGIVQFFRKHKYKIVIGLVGWVILLIINHMLGANKDYHKPIVTYEKHVSTLDTKEKVPEKLQAPIEAIIDEYFNYCNNKEYEKAYNMLSDEYKQAKEVTFNMFKTYMDTIFYTNRIYNIQNYSNLKDIYIYNVRILEDIMATGLTGKEDLEFIEEKVVIKNEKGNLKISIGGYIGEEELNKTYENEHMKITVLKKIIEYSTEKYMLNIVNRTDNTIVLKDLFSKNQITLNIGDTERSYTRATSDIIVSPGARLELEMSFDKFVDDGRESLSLKFNNVKIVEEYNRYTLEDEEVLRKYSIEINL